MKNKDTFINCLAHQLSQARKHAFEWYGSVLAPLELTPNFVYVLGILQDVTKATPTELAQEIGVAKPTITALLDRLENKGLINRTAHESKRTTHFITLTAEGEKACNKAYEVLRKADHEIEQLLGIELGALKNELEQFNQITTEVLKK